MLASSCATIRLSICLCAPSRFGTIASTSSMNTMLGAAAAAAAKSCLIFCSDSPDTPATISGAAMQKNGTPASRAMACARVVFPHPGGPCSSTPRGGSTPSHVYSSGCVSGHKISSRIARSDSSMPPRSPRRTSRGGEGAKAPPASPSPSVSVRPNGSRPGPFPEPPFWYFAPPGRYASTKSASPNAPFLPLRRFASRRACFPARPPERLFSICLMRAARATAIAATWPASAADIGASGGGLAEPPACFPGVSFATALAAAAATTCGGANALAPVSFFAFARAWVPYMRASSSFITRPFSSSSASSASMSTGPTPSSTLGSISSESASESASESVVGVGVGVGVGAILGDPQSFPLEVRRLHGVDAQRGLRGRAASAHLLHCALHALTENQQRLAQVLAVAPAQVLDDVVHIRQVVAPRVLRDAGH